MKKKKGSIGRDPLDALFSTAEAAADDEAPKAKKAKAKPKAEPPRAKKTRVTFHLTEDLIDHARDTVFALSGPPLSLTLSEFAEEAIRREIRRLERAQNEGERFPPRSKPLKTGRPMKL